ncbi:MAG: hypothetical protein N3A69_01820 [Leptospiraceae bacterium]|nr:hypothetical protein [Leptospiraceae bacterium]
MKKFFSFKSYFFLTLLVVTINCKTLLLKSSLAKENEESIRICFWNVKNLSIAGLKRESKGSYILKFSTSCDSIVYLEIRSASLDMAKAFEEAFQEKGEGYTCLEGEPKSLESSKRKEKYLACIREEWSENFAKLEYEDETEEFARPPTFFFFLYQGKKFLLIPFHSTPGSKEELKNFQKVVDFAYRNYSDYRIFFGGDFNTGSNYQKAEFLATLPYFVYLEQLIREPTTLAGQKHDLIFTDKANAILCKGKVWRLNEIFEDVEGRKNLEKISDHFPISAECKL